MEEAGGGRHHCGGRNYEDYDEIQGINSSQAESKAGRHPPGYSHLPMSNIEGSSIQHQAAFAPERQPACRTGLFHRHLMAKRASPSPSSTAPCPPLLTFDVEPRVTPILTAGRNSEFYEENRMQKLTRRLKEEPLVPLGCVLTIAALVGASRSMRAGDHDRTNKMFRARIYAQGFTVLALVAGSVYWKTDRQKRKEFDQAVAERKIREKREAWVKELEARDDEMKELRAAREARRQGGKPSITMEQATAKLQGSSKKNGDDKWKGDAAEMQLGVASSASEKDGNKSMLGTVQGWIWGSKK